jgi:hypothetical protein
MLLEFFATAASTEATRHPKWIKSRASEDKPLAIGFRHYPRSLIFELIIEMLDPKVRRLHHM